MSFTLQIESGRKRRSGQELIKRVVLTCVRNLGPICRADVVAVTRLRPTTVSKVTNELIRLGMLRATAAGPSRGGRRPILLDMNAGFGSAVGIGIMSDRVIAVRVDLKGGILARAERRADFSGQDDLVEAIVGAAKDVLTEGKGRGGKVLGVGISVPGLIDRENGVSLLCARHPWWKDIPLGRLVGQRLGIPVRIENDTRALALAEKWFGESQDARHMLYVDVGREGIGACLIADEDVFRGAWEMAGELGHVVVDAGGRVCHCGRRGCLETRVSARVLEEIVGAGGAGAAAADREPILDEVRRRCDSGEERVRRAVGEMGDLVGVAIVNAIHLLNPDSVVVGGTMTRALREHWESPIRRAVKEQSLGERLRGTPVGFSRLDDDQAAIGASSLVLSTMFGMRSAIGQSLRRGIRVDGPVAAGE
jgi:predicted NBD/HSP70 family sugar kinase